MDVNAPIFLDSNFLVRATVMSAPYHNEVRGLLSRLQGSQAEIWISRQILREYAAVVTRPQTFMQPLTSIIAAATLRQFERDFKIAEDSAAVTANLLTLLEMIPMGGKQIHDANIVATMQAYNIRQLLTFNTVDFTRFAAHIQPIDP